MKYLYSIILVSFTISFFSGCASSKLDLEKTISVLNKEISNVTSQVSKSYDSMFNEEKVILNDLIKNNNFEAIEKMYDDKQDFFQNNKDDFSLSFESVALKSLMELNEKVTEIEKELNSVDPFNSKQYSIIDEKITSFVSIKTRLNSRLYADYEQASSIKILNRINNITEKLKQQWNHVFLKSYFAQEEYQTISDFRNVYPFDNYEFNSNDILNVKLSNSQIIDIYINFSSSMNENVQNILLSKLNVNRLENNDIAYILHNSINIDKGIKQKLVNKYYSNQIVKHDDYENKVRSHIAIVKSFNIKQNVEKIGVFQTILDKTQCSLDIDEASEITLDKFIEVKNKFDLAYLFICGKQHTITTIVDKLIENSTYIRGTRQVENPRFLELSIALKNAEYNLNYAYQKQQADKRESSYGNKYSAVGSALGNFSNSFNVRSAKSEYNRIFEELRGTPRYIRENISEPYQYTITKYNALKENNLITILNAERKMFHRSKNLKDTKVFEIAYGLNDNDESDVSHFNQEEDIKNFLDVSKVSYTLEDFSLSKLEKGISIASLKKLYSDKVVTAKKVYQSKQKSSLIKNDKRVKSVVVVIILQEEWVVVFT